MKTLSIALHVLVLTSLIAPAFAQDDGSAEDPIDHLLAVVRDDTKDPVVRAQAIFRILAEGEGRARTELSRLLTSAEAPEDLRLMIATGVLMTPAFPLLDQVVSVVASEGPLAGRVRGRFGATASAALVRALSDRIDSEKTGAERRLVLIELLGFVERRDAMALLLDLWASDDEEVSAVAAEAFHLILPKRFPGFEAAREFLDANPDLNVSRLCAKLLGESENGAKKIDPMVPPLVELARKMAENATLAQLLQGYLRFGAMAEIRKIGAEWLAKYDYEAREAAGAEEARKKAAAVLLDVLDRGEKDDGVLGALLQAAQTLTKSMLATDPVRTVHVISRCLASESPAIRLAAVNTLGRLGDRRAIPALQDQFNQASPADADYRLAVLNALEIIRNAQGLSNGGMSKWFLAKLTGDEKIEAVIIRLIEILGGYEELPGAVPPLAELLRTSKNVRIRRSAADRLGRLGARRGVPEALDALAMAGLADEDTGVREVSATQLGIAPADSVPEAVLARLVERLGEVEDEKRVRVAAALSLLSLQGTAALSHLMPFLDDDEIWQEAVLAWLTGDVLTVEDGEGPGQAVVAAGVLSVLSEARAWARCADVGRRVLAASALVWDGPAKELRVGVAFDLARALAELGESKEALEVFPKDELSVEPVDSESFDRGLLHAWLLREGGRAEEAVKELVGLIAAAPSIEGVAVEGAQLELGRCHLALRNWAAVAAAVAPILDHADLGAAAREIGDAGKLGRQLAGLVADLGVADVAKHRAAVEGLRGLGVAAWPALDRWLTEREADSAATVVAAAVATIAEITGRELSYDSAASEDERRRSLAAAHAALRQ